MSSFQPEFLLSQKALRVRFGPGVRRDRGTEIERLGSKRAAVLSTPEKRAMAEELAADIGDLAAGIVPLAAIHTPVPVTEASPVLGQTEGWRKATLTDPRVKPQVILHDAELLRALPISRCRRPTGTRVRWFARRSSACCMRHGKASRSGGVDAAAPWTSSCGWRHYEIRNNLCHFLGILPGLRGLYLACNETMQR